MPDFVEVFARIHGSLPGASNIPATAKWLANNGPGMPLGDVHERLKTLRAKGWVRTHKGTIGNDYAGLVIEPVSQVLLEKIHALVQAVPGRSWAAAFHAERPVFLDTLHHVGTVTEAARISGLATSTAYDTTRLMHDEATLVRDGNHYRLNDRIPSLHEAIHEAARITVVRDIASDQADGTPFNILWHRGPEALITANDLLRGLEPGGLDAFAAFGLKLETRRRTYFHAKRGIGADDAILQAIIADPASKQSKTYAALLYEKERPPTLDEKAAWYGLHEMPELRDVPAHLREYVNNRAEAEGFLQQREYDRLKELYGVSA